MTKRKWAGGPHFSFTHSPAVVYYYGRILPLRKMQARILICLIMNEIVTVDALLSLGPKNPATLRAQICMLRRSLPPHIRVVSIYAKGYSLAFE
jgi:hypothetical protein